MVLKIYFPNINRATVAIELLTAAAFTAVAAASKDTKLLPQPVRDSAAVRASVDLHSAKSAAFNTFLPF